MTSYEQGFLAKCAEYGINPYFAGRLLKTAQTASATEGAQQQQRTVAPQAPKPVTPAIAPPPAPVTRTLSKGQGSVQPKPVTQAPTAKTKSQTPAWKQQIQAGIQGLTPEQKQSFTNWYRTGGEVMDDLFRGKDG